MKKSVKIYELLKKIPKGKVTTYGEIGKAVGLHPRTVGIILHQNPDEKNIPCHRVVNSKGKLASNFAFGGLQGQRTKLEGEGVTVNKDRVDLQKYFHVLKS